jgi:hypothetical protein
MRIMKTITKGLVGTVAAGAMAMASAAPAQARSDRDGIGAGEVIAGALIIGGIAAIAASIGNDNDDRYRDGRSRDGYRGDDRRGYGTGYGGQNGYNPGISARSAVEQCVQAAERTANRYSYGGRSKVTDIRDLDRERDGYEIKGRIAVNTKGRQWRAGDSNYGRGWNGDHRGWNSAYRGYDSGSFSCKIRYGRVVDLDFSGIRGL